MASERDTLAADVIPLFEILTAMDLDVVITAAEQQRDAGREGGNRKLVEEFRARADALSLFLGQLPGGRSRLAARPGNCAGLGKARQRLSR
jgi:hypothetical protein